MSFLSFLKDIANSSTGRKYDIAQATQKKKTAVKTTPGYTNEEIARIMNASRLPSQMQKQYYTTQPKLSKRVVQKTKESAELNPGTFGFLQALNPIDTKKTLETAVGKIDTTKAENTLAYKVGYGLGLAGQYATGGGIGQKAVAEGLYKGGSKLAKFGANRLGDVIASAPLNIADSVKTSDNGKDFAKNLALNTALDVGIGGLVDLPQAIKALKGTKIPNAEKSIPTKSEKVVLPDNAKVEPKAPKVEVKVEAPVVEDYRMSHKAPYRDADDFNKSLDKIDEIFPKDILDPKVQFRNYSSGGFEQADKEAFSVINSIKGNPDAEVTIYRAVPKNVNTINDDDWVTLSKSYAEGHIEHSLPDGHVISKKVKASDIFTDANSIQEWGYSPAIKQAPVEPKVTEVTPDLKAVETKTAEQVQKETAQPIQQSAKNQYDSAPVEAQTILQDRIARGDVDLVSRKQKDALDIAVDKVNKDPVKARQELDAVTNFTDRDLALTEALKTHYKQIGDMDNYVEMVVKASNSLSETGRSLSAARMLFNATPEGRTASVIRNIKNVQEKYAKRIDGEIEIDPVKIERLGNAQTPEEMDSIIQEIGIDTWNQIPGSLWEKFNAFRRTSLLLNPKTMIRNFLGNIVFVPARAGKNVVATGLESAFKRAGILDTKTQSILNLTNADDVARINYGKEIFDENAPSIMSNSRFSETARPIEANVYGSTPIGQVLEWTRRLTGKGLEGGDKLILKPAYSHALARYMKANNLFPQTITKEELALAENVAREEALRSTFRDAHFISDALIRFKAIEGKNAFQKGVGIALEGTVPFVKTPLNVVRRAFDYSPIGITKGVVRIMKAAKEGNNAGVVRGIDNLASGLTGTGLIALGYYLGSIGVLNGRIPYDEYGNFQKGQGEQGYSLNIGDTSITVDWITPAILPMLTGVEIAKQVATGGFDPMGSIDALGDIATPVTELSMMSGFADVLESVSNTDSAGATVIGTALTPFMNYAGQYIPTVSGQIARAIDPVRRSTTSTAENATMRRIEKFGNKQKAKIPGLSKTLEPFVDAWGREQVATTYDRTIENFLTPFYTSKKNVTQVDKEITALYKDLSEDERNKILPKLKSSYTVSFEGDQVRLSPKDMTLFNKDKGQASFKQLSDLFSTEEYKSATGEEKADMIAKIYTETNKIAKIDTLLSKGKDEWKVWTDDMEGGKADYTTVKDAGLTPEQYYYLFKDVELNGKQGTSRYEAFTKLESTDLTTEQKAILWNKYNANWVEKNNPYLGGSIPTNDIGKESSKSASGSGSGSGSRSGSSSKTTTGLATKQVNKLKTLNLDTSNGFTKAELNAIIKMLS